ncbi:hypothetical protein BDN71DRAFT_1564120 [Pleurotus eryngii]|uniref:Uncharacterized protein n=1 Tax=Pleurotus eryngii TaxID=5323 RepID=A0A9P6D7R2_PLEER|nr:hypothetical protein BDN71DRAFT_1564120 [Pleurotus eryngii]
MDIFKGNSRVLSSSSSSNINMKDAAILVNSLDAPSMMVGVTGGCNHADVNMDPWGNGGGSRCAFCVHAWLLETRLYIWYMAAPMLVCYEGSNGTMFHQLITFNAPCLEHHIQNAIEGVAFRRYKNLQVASQAENKKKQQSLTGKSFLGSLHLMKWQELDGGYGGILPQNIFNLDEKDIQMGRGQKNGSYKAIFGQADKDHL